MTRDAVSRLPLIWITSPSVTPSSAMAERGMRAIPPPLSSALAFATCSLTCFSLTGASAKACLPQNSQNAEDRMVVPDFRPPSAQARFIPQRTKASGAACGGMSSSAPHHDRSEEHTSELQSLMRISYAVFCLKKKKIKKKQIKPQKTKHYQPT